jgi:hypothetical protein
MRQRLSRLRVANYFTILFSLGLFLTPSVLEAQISPSGQVKIVAPTTLSGCNNDTISLELTNL